MSEPTGSAHPQGEGVPPNHLGTNVPSGEFVGAGQNEKGSEDVTASSPAPAPMQEKKPGDDDEEEEDMDALIEELESHDGHVFDEEEEETEVGGARPVPEEVLATDTRMGLTDQEVTARRKKYGLNQMKEEKENMILKFLSYFVGPIQFVMEVGFESSFSLDICFGINR